jgi:hypothetical protein
MGMYDPWGAENVNDLQPYEVFATHRSEPDRQSSCNA